MRYGRLFTNNRSLFTKSLIFLFGVYIGLNCTNWLTRSSVYKFNLVERCSFKSNGFKFLSSSGVPKLRRISDEMQTRKLLLVGIMTAEKFLASRATAVYNTWGKSLPGKTLFFGGNKRGKAPQLPIITLAGVDDTYPPQRKSLMMLKYLHDHYIDQYEWFMRCDDDVYIRTDKLEEFLRSLDSSQDLFMGQAGVGTHSERGLLGLGPTDNFCMGGPGVIMSRSVLKKLAPHLQHCAENLVSTHEDVEVGRCVKKYVGISCTWAFEMQWLFYHNQSKSHAFHWDLQTKAVQNAITLHPVKDPSYMYRIHTHFLTQQISAVQHRSILKATLLKQLEQLTEKNPPAERLTKLKEPVDLYFKVPSNTTLPWEVFNPKELFTVSASAPTLPVQHSIRRSLNVILRDSLALISQESRKIIFRELVLSKVNLGYMRVSPMHGVQYILDMRMITYQHLGFSRRKLPLNVQYQAHLQQQFGNLVYTSSSNEPTSTPYIHIILPLAGRLAAFSAFLANFEKVVLLNSENVRLLIMYFPDVAPFENHKKILKIYQDQYPGLAVIWKTVKGSFSRGLALQLGVSHFSPDSLLFFCDVDLTFDVEFLERCQRHSVRRKRVYYPMVFSQFNQSIGEPKESISPLHGEKGFWRKYGFGILCAYGEDVLGVGGFDTEIQGWGLEDVKLYEHFLSSGRYDVIRAPDPGLVHIHHASSCTAHLEPDRLRMCRASRTSQLASASSLVDHMERKRYF